MARRHTFQFETQEEPGLDMSSLIDVSFLLLIYFIATATLQKKETDLGLVLPASTPSGNAPFELEPMTIKITPDGQVSLNKEVVEEANDNRILPTLTERLSDYKKLAEHGNQKPLVIVAADNSSKQQRFVDVINTLAGVGINSVTLTGFREGS